LSGENRLYPRFFNLQERPCSTEVRKFIPVNQKRSVGIALRGLEHFCFADPP